MGMDVYGQKPKSEAGKYFRASVWSWAPLAGLITSLIAQHNLTFSYTVQYWHTNDGDGLKTQKDCNKLADAIDEFLITFEGDRMEEKPDPECAVDSSGIFIRKEEAQKRTDIRSPYGIDKSHIEEFVTFLRNCGGFKIH